MFAHTMPFGRHKGSTLDAIPTDYLRWAERELTRLGSGLKQAIRDEVARRDGAVNRAALPVIAAPLVPDGETFTTTATTDDPAFTGAVERAGEILDWLSDNVEDLRRYLGDRRRWDGRPLDLAFVTTVSAAAGTAAALLDPMRLAEKAQKGA
jgi:hypothetical protein